MSKIAPIFTAAAEVELGALLLAGEIKIYDVNNVFSWRFEYESSAGSHKRHAVIHNYDFTSEDSAKDDARRRGIEFKDGDRG